MTTKTTAKKDVPRKVVFLSHSSRDREIVAKFRDSFLPERVFEKKPWTRLFTSDTDPHSTGVLRPGSAIWKEIRGRIWDTAYFIACVSEEYFKSTWCLAELALYEERMEQDKSLGFAVLVLDPDFQGWATNPLTQDKLVTSITTAQALEQLKVSLQKAAGGKGYQVNATAFVREIRPLLLSHKRRDKAHLLELAREHFHHRRTSNGPVGGLVSRSEYVEIATQMGNKSRWKLLWTLYKSPLMIADAYLPHRDKKFLMDYDRSWAMFDKIQKIRLVIFEDKEEVSRYIKINEATLKHLKDAYWGSEKWNWIRKLKVPNLTQRRQDFESTAKDKGGTLFFTAKSLLSRCLPQSGSGETERPSASSDFLEFAYADCGFDGSDCLIMESGFNSEFARATSTGSPSNKKAVASANPNHKAARYFGHVVFYQDPGADCLDAIRTNPAYRLAFGHLNVLRIIAAAVFSDPPDPKVFFLLDRLSELEGSL